jgi:hypothetical protein
MKRLLLGIFILFTSVSGFSQKVDTLKVRTTDLQYNEIVTIRSRHGGPPDWYHEMNRNAPNGYYFAYMPRFDDSTRTFLLREGLFLNGYKVGEWIEYRMNGKKYCIENWDEKGRTGYKKFFTERGKPNRYIRWVDGEIVEDICYRKCKE